jgi:hypothetical protein
MLYLCGNTDSEKTLAANAGQDTGKGPGWEMSRFEDIDDHKNTNTKYCVGGTYSVYIPNSRRPSTTYAP